jgi:cytoskeleton protein RodZ
MLQPAPNNPNGDAEGVAGREQPQRANAPTPALDPAWRAGRKLSEARRQLGLSLDQVAERIRVRREFLEALEDMNVKLLPGKAYTLAFLRSYARELGVEEKAIVDQFQHECALTREDVNKPIRNPSSRPHRERPWLAAAALLVLAVGFVGWRALQQPEVPQNAETAAAEAQSSQPALAQAATAAARVVEIKALADAWLEVRGPDGTVFLSRTLRAGDVYRPDASPGWTLHARDGGAFELYVNGASAGLLGTAGMPVLGRGVDGVQPLTQAGLTPPRS